MAAPSQRMILYFTPTSDKHNPIMHIAGSEVTKHPEEPRRGRILLQAAQNLATSTISSERQASDEELRMCHEQDLIDFISGCYESVMKSLYPEGIPEGRKVEWLPDTLALSFFPERTRVTRGPLYLKAGLYCCDTSTPIMEFTAQEARKAAALAIDAAKKLMSGENLIYSLCRPPGHHAAPRAYGGFCYYNNVALAAETLSKEGKVAILDIDYHHGNGTQEIFYKRNDVYFLSIHADPDFDYPYYWGSAEELGEEQGLGFNKNYPLPLGTSFIEYEPCFNDAISRIQTFDPKYILISLGLDAAAGDPICQFLLHPPDYYKMGSAIRILGKPVLVVQEGGYSGDDTLFSCLTGFLKGLRGLPFE